MASIAILSAPGAIADGVAGALRGLGAVSVFGRITDLVAEVDAGGVSAVVLTAARDAEEVGVLQSIIALRQRHPLLWIMLCHGPVGAEEPDIVALASVALPIIWVGTDPNRLQAVVAGALAVPPPRRALAEVQLLFATYAPRQVREILAVVLANTHRRFLPRDVGAALSTAGRTLRGRLRRAGWPELRDVIAWSRILHAGFLLDILRQPPKQVAGRLAYHSAAALNASFKLRVGMTAREVLERGGYPYLLERFDQVLRASGASRRWPPEGFFRIDP